MATTTNYGWTTPDDTALVKDGASAIRTLGSSIDTSLNNALGTKKAGLVLLNTTSFSGVSSVSLPASTFTSTYANYKIVFQGDSSTAGNEITIRMRASGTDNSSNVYYSARMGNFAYNTAFFGNATNPGTSSNAITGFDLTTRGCQAILEVSSPQEAKGTFIRAQGNWGYFNSVSSITHDSATQFDSMSFIANAGNITGKVYAYGYNA